MVLSPVLPFGSARLVAATVAAVATVAFDASQATAGSRATPSASPAKPNQYRAAVSVACSRRAPTSPETSFETLLGLAMRLPALEAVSR